MKSGGYYELRNADQISGGLRLNLANSDFLDVFSRQVHKKLLTNCAIINYNPSQQPSLILRGNLFFSQPGGEMIRKIRGRLHLILFVLGLLIFTLLACNFPPLANQMVQNEDPPNIIYVTATPQSSSPGYEDETPFDPNEMDGLPEAAAEQWQVRTATNIPLLSADVGPEGGTLTVSQPGSPLDGFSITIPQGAYEASVHFEISSAEVTSINLDTDLELITPLIVVENGGVVASEFLQLRLPRQIADGRFAMLFTYDLDSQSLDALPLVEIDSTHLTALTTHFSNILGVEIDTAKLDALKIQTGFKQGRNNFQFANNGSFFAPGGHCAGQTLMAMDYYLRFKGEPLFGKYDNYNNTAFPATPNQQDDDRLAYRMCSVAQKRLDWDGKSNQNWLTIQKTTTEYFTYYSFALAMKASGEPQLVAIYDNAGGGHALIMTGKYADRFYISDPNYPLADAKRYISFNRTVGEFRTYYSGPNAEDLGKPYPYINYLNKYFLINDSAAKTLWAELDASTVGQDQFPQYKLLNTLFLPDSSTTKNEITNNYVFVEGLNAVIGIESAFDARTIVFDKDNHKVLDFEGAGPDLVTLSDPLGTPFLFAVYGKVGTKWRWVDGQWVTFYEGISGTWHGPACAEGETNPYRWEITLDQTMDGLVIGKVYFHACPGGGAVFYDLSGTQKPGEDWVTLTGSRTGGRGGLGNNAARSVTFTVKLNEPPTPNFAP